MQFVNPYNFIPLTDKKADYVPKEEKLTGKLVVEIETKTPLFIPDTSNEKVFSVDGEDEEHKSYDFFKYGGEPVIPGSEIRGMLRCVYEALTGSCLSAIDDDAELVKRTNEIYKPGLIKKVKNGYILVEADRTKCRDNGGKFAGYKTDKGYYLKGEKGFKGTARSYFNPVKDENKADKKVCDLTDVHFNMIETVLKSYQNTKTNKHLSRGHYGYKDYDKSFKKFLAPDSKSIYFPVYYSKVSDKLIYLSPACITKEAYVNKVSDILKAHGQFGPCSAGKLCPACALFGMVNDGAVASKLRFSDARLVKYDKFLFVKNPVTLEELAQPKISATEFYLKKPGDVNFWTYDYYVDKNGKIHEYVPEIAGRKFYWHNLNMRFKQNVERTKRNKTIMPLQKGVTFESEIYFERISEEQLKQLYAICNITNEYDDKAGYKLGTGKPLGMGSITIKVKECKIRELKCDDTGICYEENDFNAKAKISDGNAIKFSEEVLPDFESMISFEGFGRRPVCYPVTNQQLQTVSRNLPMTEGFKWFQENHGKLSKRVGLKYKTNLPTPTKERAQ